MPSLLEVWSFVRPVVRLIVIILIGYGLIRCLMKFVDKGFAKTKVDPSLAKYCSKTIAGALYIFVGLAALDAVGVSTSGVVAAMSAGLVAVGVALKDSLNNVAGGVWLLFSPRFSTGDFISTSSGEGFVVSVELMHTTLKTIDSKLVSIPNGVLVNSQITNFSKESRRRVEIIFPIPFEADVQKAKDVARKALEKHPLVLREPELPFVRVRGYTEYCVNLMVRVWCERTEYWNVFFDLTEEVRTALEQAGIRMQYRQMEVHLKEK